MLYEMACHRWGDNSSLRSRVRIDREEWVKVQHTGSKYRSVMKELLKQLNTPIKYACNNHHVFSLCSCAQSSVFVGAHLILSCFLYYRKKKWLWFLKWPGASAVTSHLVNHKFGWIGGWIEDYVICERVCCRCGGKPYDISQERIDKGEN